jgi:predicted acyl esterase
MGPLKNFDEQIFKGQNRIWNQMMENETYNDFWKARTPVPHLKNIKPAVMVVGGWFDQEDLYGPLKDLPGCFQQESANPQLACYGPVDTRGLGSRHGRIAWKYQVRHQNKHLLPKGNRIAGF